jgi:hypothetical protein
LNSASIMCWPAVSSKVLTRADPIYSIYLKLFPFLYTGISFSANFPVIG